MRDFPGKIAAFIEQHLTLVLIALPLLISLVMLFLGVGLPQMRATDAPILINEVYANPEEERNTYWLELYNNTDEGRDLAGWTIRSSDGETRSAATLTGVTQIGPGSYLLVPADPQAFAQGQPILASAAATPDQVLSWSATGGTLELLDEQGRQVDAARWTATRLSNQPSLVRATLGLDTDQSTDWRAGPPSPGGISLPTVRPMTRFILVEATNYASLIGGFLLWAAFVIIGLIARRFERLTSQRTFWQAMVVAPVGIIIYNIIQTRAFFRSGSMTDCRTEDRGWIFGFNNCEQLWSFVPLFLAAVVMTYVILLFYRAARRILEV